MFACGFFSERVFSAKYHILLKTPNPNMGKMVDLLSMRVCFRLPVCRKFDSLIVD